MAIHAIWPNPWYQMWYFRFSRVEVSKERYFIYFSSSKWQISMVKINIKFYQNESVQKIWNPCQPQPVLDSILNKNQLTFSNLALFSRISVFLNICEKNLKSESWVLRLSTIQVFWWCGKLVWEPKCFGGGGS